MFDKEKYLVHYENLKLYLRLKQYVDFNTRKRIEAEKSRGKDGKALYKLMNNTVYGKTLENLKNRIDVIL